jgi:DNA-binding IclR family transcriptional regulator
MNETSPITPSPVGAVASAARILGCLGAAKTPLRLTQISRPLDINTSTCLNILRTLVAEGFVRTDPGTKTYRLGRRIVELARDVLNQGEDIGALRPAMDELAQKYGITVMLWGKLGSEHLILLAAAIGKPLSSIHASLGMRVPLLSGSMGRLFAADLDGDTIRRLYAVIEWDRPVGLETYLRQVKEATERGWAVDEGYFNTAMWGLSAPVAHPGAPLDRVISAVLLSEQHDPATIEQIARDLMAAGRGVM